MADEATKAFFREKLRKRLEDTPEKRERERKGDSLSLKQQKGFGHSNEQLFVHELSWIFLTKYKNAFKTDPDLMRIWNEECGEEFALVLGPAVSEVPSETPKAPEPAPAVTPPAIAAKEEPPQSPKMPKKKQLWEQPTGKLVAGAIVSVCLCVAVGALFGFIAGGPPGAALGAIIAGAYGGTVFTLGLGALMAKRSEAKKREQLNPLKEEEESKKDLGKAPGPYAAPAIVAKNGYEKRVSKGYKGQKAKNIKNISETSEASHSKLDM